MNYLFILIYIYINVLLFNINNYSQFNVIIEKIKDSRKENEYFKGISIFTNHLYPDWKSFRIESDEEEEEECSAEKKQSVDENHQPSLCHASSSKDCFWRMVLFPS